MFIFFLIMLALFIVYALAHNFTVGVVLGGLLSMVWTLYSRLEVVNRRLKDMEAKLLQRQPSSEEATDRPVSYEQPSVTEPSAGATNVSGPDEYVLSTSRQSDEIPFLSDLEERADEQLLDAQKAVMSDPESDAIEEARSVSLSRQGETPSTQQRPERGEAVSVESASELSPQAEAPAAKVSEPRGPNIIEKLIAAGWSWVTDGNVFVRVGMIVLFMGMTFLTRYAIGQDLIPIEVRLAAISAVALALLFWGWRQRETRQSFSLVVQGGGIGLLYLTIFAGFSLYDVIPSTVAFILLALIVILAAMLSVTQDAKPLALFATIGGFLAPVLTSSGNNNYIGLFSYYSLLNLGIFTVAWFKSWRILNFVGFVFTFLISTVWGVLSYQKEFFATTEPFLILFFLLYVAIGILFAHKRTPFYKNYVDSSLIFGTPIFAFGLQCAMVKDYEYGVAISAACLGVFYLLLTSVLWKKFGERLRLLSETFLSLGVIFATLAIPFAIDGNLSGAAWAIEGAGILWISIKQQQKYRRFFGTALIFAAGAMLIYGLQTAVTENPFINSFFIGCVIITIAATLASWLLWRDFEGKVKAEGSLSKALLIYALIALLGGFELEIVDFSLFTKHGTSLAILSGLSIIVYTALANKLKWPYANWVSVGFVIPLSAAAMLCVAQQTQLAEAYGYVLWPFVLTVYFYALKQAVGIVGSRVLLSAHILAAGTIVGLLLWEGIWQLMLGYSLLAIVFNQLSNRFEWPQLKILALGFFPVLVLSGVLATSIDGDLVTLSNNASSLTLPFPPGIALWPFSFAVYFYLVHQNREIGGAKNKYLHYAGGLLIGALLLWLGVGPLLLGASLLAALFCVLWQKFDWLEMRVISMALLPVMLLISALKILDGSFHAAGLEGLAFLSNIESGFYLWPLSFVVMFWTFWQYDKHEQAAPALLHSAGLLLLSLLLTWEVSWHVLDYVDLFNAWHMAWLPIVAMLIIERILRGKTWPFTMHSRSYHDYALPVLVMIPIVWSFVQLASSGSSSPLPWVPLMNPLDIVQIIILMGAYFWGPRLLPQLFKRLSSKQVVYGLVGYGFLWANIDLLRAIHHWVGIPWEFPGIVSADISQTLIALFWALGGLVVTIYASRKQERTLWFFGGALLVAVVLKLFLVDLSAQDTIERIVSFTGVGLLLVAVGYFSPLPPKEKGSREESSSPGGLDTERAEEKADV